VGLTPAERASVVVGKHPTPEGDLQRVVVRVAPQDIGRRLSDQMPAEFRIAAADFADGRRIDLGSLQVTRCDAGGQALSDPLPLRWYDDAVPYDFPEEEQNAHATAVIHTTAVIRPRWGDFFNPLGDGLGGRLAWPHTQQGGEPSSYAVSFRRTSATRVRRTR